MADYYLLLGFASGSIVVIAAGLYAYVAFRDRPAPAASDPEPGAGARSGSQ